MPEDERDTPLQTTSNVYRAAGIIPPQGCEPGGRARATPHQLHRHPLGALCAWATWRNETLQSKDQSHSAASAVGRPVKTLGQEAAPR